MNQKDLNRNAVTAGFFYILTQMLVRGLTFFITPVYTRMMSASQYGQVRVYESWLLMFVPLMSLGLYRSVERAKYDYADDYDGYTASALALSYLSIAVWVFGFVCFYRHISEFLGIGRLLFFYMVLYLFGYTALVFYQRCEKQKMEYKHVMLVTVAAMLPAAVGSVLLPYWGNKNGYARYLVQLRVIGYYTPQIVAGIVLAVVVLKRAKHLARLDYWGYGVKYSLPLVPDLLSIQIMNQSDKIMVQKMSGHENAGIFALASTVSYIMWVMEESVWNAWLPWLYEKIERGEGQDVHRPWFVIAGIFGLATWMLVMVSPEMVLFFGGKGYTAAAYLAAPMLLGTLFRFFGYIYSAMQNYYKITKYEAYGTSAVMVLNVCLNYAGIARWGYQAAAYTTAFSYFALIAVQAYLEKAVTGSCMIPASKMLLFAAVTAVCVLSSMALFPLHWILRWGIAGMAGLGCVLYMAVLWKRRENRDGTEMW